MQNRGHNKIGNSQTPFNFNPIRKFTHIIRHIKHKEVRESETYEVYPKWYNVR